MKAGICFALAIVIAGPVYAMEPILPGRCNGHVFKSSNAVLPGLMPPGGEKAGKISRNNETSGVSLLLSFYLT
ncbi:hypothetical protein [Yokenella regensburgei]|uniref:hypothetical protein n=1 Tax=Yokenella regensburgei TaxID=158877 RepID=UPI0014331690|nr:hypothetical protein [Yokenella regensburgei]QIU87852.1 hypothetical protein HEC60_06185 [Yokenella regensburgei]